MSFLNASGKISTEAFSPGRWSLNAVLRIRIISDDSLLTIDCVFLSNSTGTVNLSIFSTSDGGERGPVSTPNAPKTENMNKNNIPSLIIRRNFEIDVLEMFCAEHRVIPSTREVIRDGKWPSVLAHVRAHDGDIDEVLQALQSPRDKRAVGPWTSVGDVEVVPPCPNNNVSSVPQNSRVKSGKWGGRSYLSRARICFPWQ